VSFADRPRAAAPGAFGVAGRDGGSTRVLAFGRQRVEDGHNRRQRSGVTRMPGWPCDPRARHTFHASALSSLGIEPGSSWGHASMSDIKSLGYIKVKTNDARRWRSFGSKTYSDSPGKRSGCVGPLYLRMRARRTDRRVVPGAPTKVVAVGWEVRDRPATATRSGRRLGSPRVCALEPMPQEEADAGRVEEAITFCDQTGTPIEVFPRAVLDHRPVVTPSGPGCHGDRDWACGVAGNRPQAAFDLYTDGWLSLPRCVALLRQRSRVRCGSGSSRGQRTAPQHGDRSSMRGGVPGHPGDGGSRQPRAVGLALDRVNTEGFQLSSTLGRHTNEKLVSFTYARQDGWASSSAPTDCGSTKSIYTRGNHAGQYGPPGTGERRWRCGGGRVTINADVRQARRADHAWAYEADSSSAGFGIAGAAAAVECRRTGADVLI